MVNKTHNTLLEQNDVIVTPNVILGRGSIEGNILLKIIASQCQVNLPVMDTNSDGELIALFPEINFFKPRIGKMPFI